MPAMTDPTNALQSLQEYLDSLEVERCELDQDLYVVMERLTGTPRFTYFRLDGRTVTAMAMLAVGEPFPDGPCFELGYAVPEDRRGQGLAKSTVQAAIAELKNGLGRAISTPFYVHAVVGVDNVASQRVAEAAVSSTPKPITDAFSGLPALQYLKKIVYP